MWTDVFFPGVYWVDVFWPDNDSEDVTLYPIARHTLGPDPDLRIMGPD